MTERKRLTVSKNTWHGRAYFFWKRNAKLKKDRNYQENLCHYVRVILIWFPLHCFFLWTPSKDKDLEGLFTPFTMFLGTGLFLFLANRTFFYPWYALMTAGVLIGLLLIGWLSYSLADRMRYRRMLHEDLPDKDPGMLGMSWEFVRAKKHRICPLIEVKED